MESLCEHLGLPASMVERCQRNDRLQGKFVKAAVLMGTIDPRRLRVPWWRKWLNYGKALWRHWTNRRRRVALPILEARRAVCEQCPHNQQGACTLCGCRLAPTRLGDKLAWASEECPQRRWLRSPPAAYTPCGPEPSVAVAISSYGLPDLVELQVAAVRRFCGPIPILISDDLSDQSDAIAALCKRLGVAHSRRKYRAGHAGGDMGAYSKGLLFARRAGCAYLVKLSQRFVITRLRWAQLAALELRDSGLKVASSACQERNARFGVRTEAVVMDVQAWCRRDVLALLRMRRYGGACEVVVQTVIDRLFQGRMHHWTLLTAEDRLVRMRDTLWHHFSSEEEYRGLALALGLHAGQYGASIVWQHQPGYR